MSDTKVESPLDCQKQRCKYLVCILIVIIMVQHICYQPVACNLVQLVLLYLFWIRCTTMKAVAHLLRTGLWKQHGILCQSLKNLLRATVHLCTWIMTGPATIFWCFQKCNKTHKCKFLHNCVPETVGNLLEFLCNHFWGVNFDNSSWTYTYY